MNENIIVNELITMGENHIGFYCTEHIPFDKFAEAIVRDTGNTAEIKDYAFKHRYMKYLSPFRDEYQPMRFSDNPRKGFDPITHAIYIGHSRSTAMTKDLTVQAGQTRESVCPDCNGTESGPIESDGICPTCAEIGKDSNQRGVMEFDRKAAEQEGARRYYHEGDHVRTTREIGRFVAGAQWQSEQVRFVQPIRETQGGDPPRGMRFCSEVEAAHAQYGWARCYRNGQWEMYRHDMWDTTGITHYAIPLSDSNIVQELQGLAEQILTTCVELVWITENMPGTSIDKDKAASLIQEFMTNYRYRSILAAEEDRLENDLLRISESILDICTFPKTEADVQAISRIVLFFAEDFARKKLSSPGSTGARDREQRLKTVLENASEGLDQACRGEVLSSEEAWRKIAENASEPLKSRIQAKLAAISAIREQLRGELEEDNLLLAEMRKNLVVCNGGRIRAGTAFTGFVYFNSPRLAAYLRGEGGGE